MVDVTDKKIPHTKKLLWLLPLILLVVFSILFYNSLGKDTQVENMQQIDTSIPAFSLPTLGSDIVVTEKDLPKTAYLLNVWGSWCSSCKQEHAFLMQLAKASIPIVGVNYNDRSKSAKAFIAKYGNPFLLSLVDENGMFVIDLGLKGAPETFVVDATGHVRQHIVGIVSPQKWQTLIKPCYDELIKQGLNIQTKQLREVGVCNSHE